VNAAAERRNPAPLRDPRWTGADREYAVAAGRGEPTRTPADMRDALAAQLVRYFGQHPDPAGPVAAGLAAETAARIVADHYRHPTTVALTRLHLLAYVHAARTDQTAAALLMA
jgi:hypothetical protein